MTDEHTPPTPPNDQELARMSEVAHAPNPMAENPLGAANAEKARLTALGAAGRVAERKKAAAEKREYNREAKAASRERAKIREQAVHAATRAEFHAGMCQTLPPEKLAEHCDREEAV